MLERIAPSPLHTLNRSVAIAEWQGPEAGLAVLDGLAPPAWLAGSYLWDAVLGDLHRRAGHPDIAQASSGAGAGVGSHGRGAGASPASLGVARLAVLNQS